MTTRGNVASFRVTRCPQDSWGYDSRLTHDDVRRLLRAGYLYPGTEIEHGGERLQVVVTEKGYTLEESS